MSGEPRGLWPEPLFWGRALRFLAGVGTLLAVLVMGLPALGLAAAIALVLLGVSFIVGGLLGNPGCEITALPNLLLPKRIRLYCF